MFTTIKDYIKESAAEDNDFGCVMLYADSPDWDKFTQRVIDKDDLYFAPDDDYGLEKQPHITVLFGLHDKKINKEQLFDILRNTPSFRIGVQDMDIFENEKFDVVKLNVPRNEFLLNMHNKFREFPHTMTHPDYNPHMTVAYVKKGKGPKYRKRFKYPINFKFNKGVYSEPDYRKSYFDLKNSYQNYTK